jgi:hypothetical protein
VWLVIRCGLHRLSPSEPRPGGWGATQPGRGVLRSVVHFAVDLSTVPITHELRARADQGKATKPCDQVLPEDVESSTKSPCRQVAGEDQAAHACLGEIQEIPNLAHPKNRLLWRRSCWTRILKPLSKGFVHRLVEHGPDDSNGPSACTVRA